MSQSSSSYSAVLQNKRTTMKFQEIKIEAPYSNISYDKVVQWKNYVCFFTQRLDIQRKMLAFDIEVSEWSVINLDFTSSKFEIESGCSHICPHDSGFYLYFTTKDKAILENIELDYQIGEGKVSLKASWNKVNIDSIPFRRFGTANFLDNTIYLFGGVDEKDSMVSHILSEIHLGNSKCIGFKDFNTPLSPGHRKNHGSVCHNRQLYIFNGNNEKGEALSDLWVLNLDSFLWSKLSNNIAFLDLRKGDSSYTLIQDEVFIFGGTGKSAENGLVIYSTKENVFEELNMSFKNPFFFAGYDDKIIFGQNYDVYNVEKEEKNKSASKNTQIYNKTMEKFYQEKPLADLTFVVEGKELLAHKALLMSKCSYFLNLFLSGMKESTEAKIVINDMKVETLEEFLKYIYLGKLTAKSETMEELYGVANKYCMPELERECANYFLDKITSKNAVRIAKLAVLSDFSDLKQKVKSFMLKSPDSFLESMAI